MNRLKSVVKDTLTEMKEARLSLSASSLAYTTILSVIPLLAVSFSIFKAFGGLDKLYGTIEPLIIENLAEGADQATLEMIRGFIGKIHAGALGATGLIGLIVTSITMLMGVENAINRIWNAPRTRSWFQRIATYWFFITLGPLAISFSFGFASTLNVPLRSMVPTWLGLYFILNLLFFLVYKLVPEKDVHWRPALFASSSAALIWIGARAIYTSYIHKIVAYDKIYGSLAAIPILLVWIYLAWLIVLTGAALCASLQKRLEL